MEKFKSKALIYVRTSSCSNLAKAYIEDCEKFCFENHLEVKKAYFDIGVKASAAKHKFIEFSQLLEDLDADDVLVCERLGDLPKYFINNLPSIPILVAGDKKMDLTPLKNFHAKRNKVLARLLVDSCVRCSSIEDIHAGKTPRSEAGDFSDVKIVFSGGEIPWTALSRISEEEIRALMLEIESHVISLLSLLFNGFDEKKLPGLGYRFFQEMGPFGYPKDREVFEIFNNPLAINKIYKNLFEDCGVSWDDPKKNKKL